MTEPERAETDRLRAESSYLLSRLVEMETRLNVNLDKLTATLDSFSKLVVPANLPRLLTPEQVAELLVVKPGAVYKWVSEGKIPFRRAGTKPRFVLDEILAWTVPDQPSKRPASGKKRGHVVGLRRQQA
jgi:excisionase family DNA binding protein